MSERLAAGPGGAHHLVIVSDLHLGGRPQDGDDPGFQLCPPESRRRLAKLVHHLAGRGEPVGPEGSLELVINGDLVDFLAEEPFHAFTGSSASAVEKLGSALRHCDEGASEGERLVPALKELVGRGHKLTLLLGNHDIELSLPEVRRELLRILTGGQPARVELVFDGEAYVIGDVLIEHGNRYDGWNSVAYGALRAFRSAASRHEEEWPFQPPAGSRLVAAVMNPLKRRYRFIDLMKPENETVIPILCALEPALAYELQKVVPLWLGKRSATGEPGRVKEEETYIAGREVGAAAPPGSPSPSEAGPAGRFESLLGARLDERTWSSTVEILDAAAREARALEREEWGERVPPELAAVAGGSLPWLSSPLSLWRARNRKAPARYRWLARALAKRGEAIAGAFELGTEDPPYHTAAERLTSEGPARVVVFGHTHLPKAIRLSSGGLYLNTGTWCPTISLEPRFYHGDPEDPQVVDELERFVAALAVGHLEAWTELRTLFAHVRFGADGGRRAALWEFHDDGKVIPLEGHHDA